MIASLGLYDLPEVRAMTDAVWRAIARELVAEGFSDVPPTLEREQPLDEQWRDPALLFAQICGYPLMHAFAGAVRVVAVPCYAVGSCDPGRYRSIVIGRDPDALRRGSIVAVNDHASHSGKNALGALVAESLGSDDDPEEPFFAAVLITGSHAASMRAVVCGDADVAAIDCITHTLVARHRPRELDGTRIVAITADAPAPAYVTRATARDDEVARMQVAIGRAFSDSDPQIALARRELLLDSIRVPARREYDRILELERAHQGRRVF